MCWVHRYIGVQIELGVHFPCKIEHFGEPVVCCQICNLINFIRTQIPRFQKISLKSGNSAVICVIESFCKEYCFFSKLGYFLWNTFLFYLNLSWLTKQNISLAVSLLLFNLYGSYELVNSISFEFCGTTVIQVISSFNFFRNLKFDIRKFFKVLFTCRIIKLNQS